MKTKFNRVLILFFMVLIHVTFAQEKKISGIISDETGPLPGVNIIKKGTTLGVESDFDGKYSIKANTGDILIFSFVGMKTTEKTVGSSNSVNVIMTSENVLDEIVITALGIKRDKKSIGYAQQSVKGEDLNRTLEADVSNALAGKVAGVQLIGAPSAGFKSAKVRLRGSTNVLYIVDNIKLNDLSSINTEDIKDISTLKGLAATALYGPDGQNGVVIVTTKKAKNGQAQITVNSGFTIDQVTNLMETQNEYGGGYSQEWDTFSYDPAIHPSSWASFNGQKTPTYKSDESWGPKLDGTPVRHWDSWIEGDPEFGKLRPWSSQPDNIKNFYRAGTTQRTSLTALKGGDDYNVKVQITHTDRESVVPNSDRKTTQAAFNVDYDINKNLNVFGNFNYQNRKTNNDLTENYGNVFSNMNQWWQRQIDIDRVRKYKRNGKIVSWNINGPTDTSPKYWDSPFFDIYENTSANERNTSFGKIGFNYNLTNDLSVVTEARTHFTSHKYHDQTGWGNLDGQAAYGEYEFTRSKDEYFAMLNYQTKINDNFDVTANIGTEISNYKLESTDINSIGGLTTKDFYSLDTSVDKPTIENVKEYTKNKAVFAKASAGYKNTVYLDGSYRLDWNSTANPNLNIVKTFSLSSSFIFSKVLPQNNILSFGKLRAGYAEAPAFPDVYSLNQTYDTEISYGNTGSQSIPNALNNINLTGGVKNEFEIGTELQFLNNRIGLDVSYFFKTDKELPVELDLDPSTGNESVFANSGKQTYKGLEIAINATPVRTENFTWNTSINFATLKREVKELALGINNKYLAAYSFDTNYWGNESMINMQERVGQEWGAIYGRKIKTNADGKKVINSDGSYVTEENQYLGNHLPDFTGGFTNTFSYKNFDLSVGIDFQKGGKYFSMTEMFSKASGNSISTVGDNAAGNPVRDPLNGTHPQKLVDGKLKDVTTIVYANSANSNTGGTLVNGVDATTGNDVSYYKDLNTDGWDKFTIGDEFLYDASYVKLRSISLSYNLPKLALDKIGISSGKIGVYANNVWLIYSEVSYIDPSELESPTSTGNDGHSFIEGGQAPSSRAIGINFQFSF
ncbi:SusC/RagA family TonB-linked outer membrane protein [Tenacibaculum pacificus]|uniref:SusC/RagA family TonB-linked outer membrane protein n=1 Tax=Tenacibaculum pacificus TaxID=3018314 RepID=UPI0022F3F5BA|nr:SusC/RagA family TonB-linked outer membrane protein [Tenacibaculum pacificus]WBX73068.1 SusC/RagA family TonB-linked outer membrane protein [Tenacibaculum pacificus]